MRYVQKKDGERRVEGERKGERERGGEASPTLINAS